MSVSYGGSSITFEDGSIVSSGSQGFKNKIINGAMVIDQRNVGTSVALPDGASATSYVMDRWAGYRVGTTTSTLQQSSDAPTGSGFVNSFIFTNGTGVTPGATASSGVYQRIEGYNIADLCWGTASAKSVTLSFWVKSSLTGTFTVAIINAAYTRSYPATYTINVQNTWEYKTIVIPGCTDGAWNTTNGVGFSVNFDMGSGSTYTATANTWSNNYYSGATGAVKLCQTTGATFYATGVQLEKGSTASSFEFRSFQKELILCQRYYEKSFDMATKPAQNIGSNSGALISGAYSTATFAIVASTTFAVRKRVSPTTLTTYNPFAAGAGWSRSGSNNYAASNYSTGEQGIGLRVDDSVGAVNANMSINWVVEAEL
jgi:hypothetical protein